MPRDLDEAVQAMLLAPRGQRNNTLNRLAFWVGRNSDRVAFGIDSAADRLRAAAGIAGLEEDEIERTLLSGLDAGIREA